MTEKYSSDTFGSGEAPEMQYGVRVTAADEEELVDALGVVPKSEATAWSTADHIIGSE